MYTSLRLGKNCNCLIFHIIVLIVGRVELSPEGTRPSWPYTRLLLSFASFRSNNFQLGIFSTLKCRSLLDFKEWHHPVKKMSRCRLAKDTSANKFYGITGPDIILFYLVQLLLIATYKIMEARTSHFDKANIHLWLFTTGHNIHLSIYVYCQTLSWVL